MADQRSACEAETKEMLASETHWHSWWNNPLILVHLGISKFSHWNFCILGVHPALDKLGHCSPSWCTCIRRCAVCCGRSTILSILLSILEHFTIQETFLESWRVSAKYLSFHKPIHCGCVGTRPAGGCPGYYCVNTNGRSWSRQLIYCPSIPTAIYLVRTFPLTPFLLSHKQLPYIKAGCRMMQAGCPRACSAEASLPSSLPHSLPDSSFSFPNSAT